MCPTSNYRELQKRLRLSFQKKFENRKNQSMCLHPCDFPYCVENCKYANDHEHQSHRCDNHQVIPNAYSQQLKPSPRHAITTLVNANKDMVQRRKYSTRRNMYVKLTAKAQKQELKDLNEALLESLDNLKWPLSTKRDHVFKQSEADERIQFGVTNSYSDGIVLSTATGKDKYNPLMNLLIEVSKFTEPPISYSTIQVTKKR